mgnify:CR=1 FL=1
MSANSHKPMTERIAFDEGQWWEFYTVVTRRMRKAFTRAQVASVSGQLLADVNLDDPEAMRQYVMHHVADLDLGALDDAYLLQGTVALNVRDARGKTIRELTPDTLGDTLDHMAEAVLVRMRMLYVPMNAEQVKNSTGMPSPISAATGPHPQS